MINLEIVNIIILVCLDPRLLQAAQPYRQPVQGLPFQGFFQEHILFYALVHGIISATGDDFIADNHLMHST